jgi:hypothetical protein
VRLDVRGDLTNGFPARILDAGLFLECRIDLEEPVVARLAGGIEQHFDRAEAFDQCIEQELISRFRVVSRHADSMLFAMCSNVKRHARSRPLTLQRRLATSTEGRAGSACRCSVSSRSARPEPWLLSAALSFAPSELLFR